MTQRVLDQIANLIQRVRAHGLGSEHVESSFVRLESLFAEDYPRLFDMQTQSYGTGFEDGEKKQKGKGKASTVKLKNDVAALIRGWEKDLKTRDERIKEINDLPVDD